MWMFRFRWSACIVACVLGCVTASVQARDGDADAELVVSQAAFDRLSFGGEVRIIVEFSTSSERESRSPAGDIFRQNAEAVARQILHEADALNYNLNNSEQLDRIGYFLFVQDSAFILNADADLIGRILTVNNVSRVIVEDPIAFIPSPNVSITAENAVGTEVIGISGEYGEGQTIAIIDTGVQLDHVAFAGRLLQGACFSTNLLATTVCPNSEVRDTHSPNAGANCSFSGCNHGTQVASVAAGAAFQSNGENYSGGVASQANILPIQVVGERGCDEGSCIFFYSTDITRALTWILDDAENSRGVDVVNISLGSELVTVPGNCLVEAYTFYLNAVGRLRGRGIPVVAGSGNKSDPDGISHPACVYAATAVGATDGLGPTTSVANFSNSSPMIDLLAPGRNIRVATTSAASSSVGGLFTGTSASAPYVAGGMAVLMGAFPEATASEVEQALEDTGHLILDNRNGLSFPVIDLGAAYRQLLAEMPITNLRIEVVGNGTVFANRRGLVCHSQSCSENYGRNSEVVLSARADSGFVFSGWSGVDCLSGNQSSPVCRVRMSDDLAATAEFVTQTIAIGPTSLIGPINGVEVGTQPSMLWREASNANRYFVVVSEDLNVIQNIIGNNLGGCSEANCIISASFSSTAIAPYNLEQACNYPDSTPSGRMDVLEPGRTYYWAVQPLRRNSCSDYGEGPWSSIGRFVTLNEVVAPANDNFVDATPISGASQGYTFTNTGASREPDEPQHVGNSGGASVWWRWTAPATAQYTIDTFQTDFDPILAIYRGTSFTNLEAVAISDDHIGDDSLVMFNAVAGDQYFIAIDGFNGDQGNGTLRIGTQGPVQYPLEISIEGSGRVAGECNSGTCVVLRGDGDAVALFANPEDGNRFDGWGGACASFGTDPNCTFPMNGPRSVVARFSPENQQTGLISTYLYPHDAIIDGAGWRLQGETAWRMDGNTATGVALGQSVIEFRDAPGWVTPDDFVLTLTAEANSREVHMDYRRPDKSLIVEFSGNGRGEITVSGPEICAASCTIPMGDTAITRVQAFPSAGSVFAGWTGDCVETSEVDGAYWCDVDFRTRSGDHTVGVQFDQDPDAERHSLTVELRPFDGAGQGRLLSSSHVDIDCVDRCTYEIADGETVSLELELNDAVLVRFFRHDNRFASWRMAESLSLNIVVDADMAFTFDLAALTSRYVASGTATLGNGQILTFPALRYATSEIGRLCQPEDASCHDVRTAGEELDVLANPQTGWALHSWNGALAASCSADQNPCPLVISENEPEYLLDALFTPVISAETVGTGSGRIIAGPATNDCTTDICRASIIDCGETCAAIAEPFGPSLAFYAVSDSDSEFVGWQNNCGSGDDPDACYRSTSIPVHAIAEFSRIVVDNTLTVSRSGTGAGNVTSDPSGIDCGSTCQADFPDMATVVLTANAAAGSVFAGWTGECASTDGNICNADMSADRSVEAVFNLEPVTISYFARGQGSGSVSSDPASMDCANDCAAEFAPGTTVTFTASPEAGSVFGGWGGICTGEELTCQRTVNADSEVWARFNLAAPPTSRIVSSIVPQSRGGPTGGTLTAFMGVTNAGEEIATECRPALRTEAGIDFSFVAIDDDQTGNPIAPDDYPVDVPPNRGDPQEFLVRFTSANAVGPVAARVLVLCSNSTTRFTPSVNTIVLTFEDTPPADIVATISTTTNNGRVEIPDGRNNGVLAGAAINVTGRDFGIPATIRVVPNTANIPLGVTLEICETDASAVCLPGSPLSDTVDVTMGADPVFLKVVLRRVPDVGVPFIPAFIRAVLDFYQVDNEGNVDPDTGLRGRTSVGLDISAPDASGIDGLWSGIARLLDDPNDVPSPVLLAIDGDTVWMVVGDVTEVIATGVQTFPDDGFVLDLETAAGSHVGVGGAFTPRHQILADSFELRQTNLRFAFVDPRMTAPALPTGSITAARLDLASRTLDGNDAMALNRSGSGSAFSGNYGDCAVTISDGTWNALRMIHSSLILSGCADAGSYPALIVPLLPFTGQDGILILVSGSGFSGAWGVAQ